MAKSSKELLQKTVLNFQHSINQKTPGGRGGIQRKMAGSLGKANSEKERGKRKLNLNTISPVLRIDRGATKICVRCQITIY